ncbi:hypothetical protein DFH08DRAFT_1026882 [Mycena albidolilacea]|uniref:C2H2-type domain-containing protein n=1 Tax=Mycena albidolilacea TaxID=1033008 RepID=A0AAD6ZKM7_9AGAR|nr:hypothetical protein DFH08DRAFT_1026882 [Mycena albidolilacea]
MKSWEPEKTPKLDWVPMGRQSIQLLSEYSGRRPYPGFYTIESELVSSFESSKAPIGNEDRQWCSDPMQYASILETAADRVSRSIDEEVCNTEEGKEGAGGKREVVWRREAGGIRGRRAGARVVDISAFGGGPRQERDESGEQRWVGGPKRKALREASSRARCIVHFGSGLSREAELHKRVEDEGRMGGAVCAWWVGRPRAEPTARAGHLAGRSGSAEHGRAPVCTGSVQGQTTPAGTGESMRLRGGLVTSGEAGREKGCRIEGEKEERSKRDRRRAGPSGGPHALDALRRAREDVQRRWSIVASMLEAKGTAAVGESQARQRRGRCTAAPCIGLEMTPAFRHAVGELQTPHRRGRGRETTAALQRQRIQEKERRERKPGAARKRACDAPASLLLCRAVCQSGLWPATFGTCWVDVEGRGGLKSLRTSGHVGVGVGVQALAHTTEIGDMSAEKSAQDAPATLLLPSRHMLSDLGRHLCPLPLKATTLRTCCVEDLALCGRTRPHRHWVRLTGSGRAGGCAGAGRVSRTSKGKSKSGKHCRLPVKTLKSPQRTPRCPQSPHESQPPCTVSDCLRLRACVVRELLSKRRAELAAQPLDFEKPGLAQQYCVECAKYYETDAAITSHWRSKVHKQRCKQLKEPAYTIEESERAAGLGPAERKPPTVATVMEDVVLAAT